MKKIALLSIVLILLVVSVVPVLAKTPGNGHGNGSGAGQGNSDGVDPGVSEQVKQQKQNNEANNGSQGNGNHGQTRMRTPFYLQGTISAIDKGAKTLSVTVVHGNAQVKQYIGSTDIALQASSTTLVFQITQGDGNGQETEGTTTPTLSSVESGGNRVPIDFKDLVIGQKVAIHGDLVNSIYTVRLITVYLQASTGESTGG
jgi:hypothetical protein